MPVAEINGIRLNYEDVGSGEPVVLVMGTGARGRVWHLNQVPDLLAAGYRVITFDNRGIVPSDECAEGFGVDDLVADVAGLIEHLALQSCRVVGVSLGAWVVQELMLARPELVVQGVLMATRGREDVVRSAMREAERALHDEAEAVPPQYRAVVRAFENLSPRTLNDDAKAREWLEIFEVSPTPRTAGVRAQLGVDLSSCRLDAYRSIRARCLVIGFGDDLLMPAHLGREVAEAIPGAEFLQVDGCGHYGYLEEPGAVNSALLDFFRR